MKGVAHAARLLAVAVAVTVTALAAPVAAHNYIKSVHRAFEASVASPCQQRMGTQPHVQVIADQVFEVEWAVGHGTDTGANSFFWFATIPLSAYDNLRADNISAILADYVKLAPLSSYKNMTSEAVMWEKHHLRLTSALTEDWYWKEPELPESDPSFIVREPIYKSKVHPSSFTEQPWVKTTQTRFKDQYLKKDARVSYASAKYPWIESVDMFQNPLLNHTLYNDQSTFARFSIPARHGPGDYIVWFTWSGYKDCVDVNVRSGKEPVKFRYGKNQTDVAKTTPATPIKQDHCEWTNADRARTMLTRLPSNRDVSVCLEACKKLGQQSCTSVQVVRAFNPEGTLPATVNVPYIPWVYDSSEDPKVNPCYYFSVHDRTVNGCKAVSTVNAKPSLWDKNPLNKTDYLCYGLIPMRDVQFQVEENFRIASEPSDPVFYSTCYSFIPAGGFLDPEPIVYTPPSWTAGDSCLRCDYHKGLYSLNLTQVSDWTYGLTASNDEPCMDCGILNNPGPLVDVQPTLSGANKPNAGIQS